MAQWLILCRFAHFGAAMLLWGGAAYGGRQRFTAALWSLLALTALIWLSLETGIAGGGWAQAVDPATIAMLLRETEFGLAWGAHAAAIAALGVALWWRRGRAWTAALALASLALTGHAAMHDGWLGLGQRANAAVHLLASGFWLGSLPKVFAALPKLGDPTERGRLERFSRFGHIAVSLVLVTGVVNTALVLGHLPTDLGNPYERLLDLKILLVAGMISLALMNQYVFMPRWRRGDRGGLRALRRAAMTEILFSALVLALVSAFATFDPR